MNVTRWLMVGAVAVLGSVWAKADSLPPPDDGHYLIDLEAWDADQDFNFIPNAQVPDETSPCLPAGNICGDASIRIDNGGHSTPEDGNFSFNSGPTGSVILYYQNTGPAITSIEITTILNTDELGDDFECSGGAIFQQCGFVEVDPPSGIELDTYFYGPFNAGGVPTVTPEPSQWAIMLLAFGGIIVARARKQSASLSFAQTQQSACQNRDS